MTTSLTPSTPSSSPTPAQSQQSPSPDVTVHTPSQSPSPSESTSTSPSPSTPPAKGEENTGGSTAEIIAGAVGGGAGGLLGLIALSAIGLGAFYAVRRFAEKGPEPIEPAVFEENGGVAPVDLVATETETATNNNALFDRADIIEDKTIYGV